MSKEKKAFIWITVGILLCIPYWVIWDAQMWVHVLTTTALVAGAQIVGGYISDAWKFIRKVQ